MAKHQDETAEFMQAMIGVAEETLQEATGKKYGICFIVWDPDDPRRANYTANTPREGTARTLIELGMRLQSDRAPGGIRR